MHTLSDKVRFVQRKLKPEEAFRTKKWMVLAEHLLAQARICILFSAYFLLYFFFGCPPVFILFLVHFCVSVLRSPSVVDGMLNSRDNYNRCLGVCLVFCALLYLSCFQSTACACPVFSAYLFIPFFLLFFPPCFFNICATHTPMFIPFWVHLSV